MIWNQSPFLRQFTALSILLLLIGIAFSLGEKMVVEPLRSRGSDIETLSKQLAEIKADQKDDKSLAKRRMEAEQELRSLNIFWSGPNRPQIAASIQDVLRVAAQQSDGQLVSTSVLQEATKDNMLAIRARIDGTLTTLQRALSAVEQSRPRLFVTSLVVTTASAANTTAKQQLLSFEISVAGYVAADDPATP